MYYIEELYTIHPIFLLHPIFLFRQLGYQQTIIVIKQVFKLK